MFSIIGVICFVILWIKVSNLSKEVNNLKSRLNNEAPSVQAVSAQAVSPQPEQTQDIQPNQPAPIYVKPQDQSDPVIDFFAWFKENWLLKVGVLLILVGFGWFISYAFVHDWIGPLGRVTLGFVTGSLLALFGYIRMPKSSTQGKMFLILGSALVIITSYAAQAVYGYFNPTISLMIVFIVSVYISTVALQFQMKSLAVYGNVVAFIAPWLTHSDIDVQLLFSYLAVVSFASIWLASIKGWREINAISVFIFSLSSLPYILGSEVLTSGEESFVLAIAFLLGFTYFLVSVFGAIKNKESADQSDIFVAVCDSVLITLATIQFIPEEIQSIVLAGWMIVFAIGSFAVFNYTKKVKFFYIYSLISVTLLAIATAIELDGPALIYAYAMESAVISVAGYVITRKINVGYNLSALMIGPFLLSLPSLFSSKWATGAFHDDFGILAILAVLLFSLGLFYYYSEKEMDKYADKDSEHFYPALIIVGSAYFLALIWLSMISMFDDRATSVFVSLIIYTLIGISTYFYGLIKEMPTFKYFGGILLILVITRLVFVDVWDMALAKRIVTFISIGILFISTAFIGKKVKGEDVPVNPVNN